MIIGVDGNEANVERRVGVNQYAAGIINGLERLEEGKKHQFIVYLSSLPLPHMPKAREGWKYRILGGSGLWIVRKLMFYLLKTREKPDVLFTPSHYSPPFLSMPSVVSIMDLGYLESHEQFRNRDFYQLKYWGMWSMFRAKKIIAISQSTKEQIGRNYPWARKKIEVVYPGYDKEKYEILKFKDQMYRSRIKSKYGITSEYLLFLSTLKPSKNVEGLLEAYSILLQDNLEKRRSDIPQLVIAGKKGWLFESIFKKAKELGLENFVIFTDFVSEEDKPWLIAGAKVFVAPSLWEGFGLHVLEAMALGVPVVASNVGSLPEVVGDAGILVNPADPKEIASGIEIALEKRTLLIHKSLIRTRAFSWQKASLETLRIFEQV